MKKHLVSLLALASFFLGAACRPPEKARVPVEQAY